MQSLNNFRSYVILIINLYFLFPVTNAIPRSTEQESRHAVLDNTYHCARSVVFNMQDLRHHAEVARKVHDHNFYKPQSQKPEFPKLFLGRIYGCNSQNRCLQWPLPHPTNTNAISPYRLILSDIMSPLGVARPVFNTPNTQGPPQDEPVRPLNAHLRPQNQINKRQRIENYVACQMRRTQTTDHIRS